MVLSQRKGNNVQDLTVKEPSSDNSKEYSKTLRVKVQSFLDLSLRDVNQLLSRNPSPWMGNFSSHLVFCVSLNCDFAQTRLTVLLSWCSAWFRVRGTARYPRLATSRLDTRESIRYQFTPTPRIWFVAGGSWMDAPPEQHSWSMEIQQWRTRISGWGCNESPWTNCRTPSGSHSWCRIDSTRRFLSYFCPSDNFPQGLESWSTEREYRPFFREKLWGGFNMLSQVTFNKEKWLGAMMLDHVTGLDPPGSKIRAAEGIDAASSLIQGYWIW